MAKVYNAQEFAEKCKLTPGAITYWAKQGLDYFKRKSNAHLGETYVYRSGTSRKSEYFIYKLSEENEAIAEIEKLDGVKTYSGDEVIATLEKSNDKFKYFDEKFDKLVELQAQTLHKLQESDAKQSQFFDELEDLKEKIAKKHNDDDDDDENDDDDDVSFNPEEFEDMKKISGVEMIPAMLPLIQQIMKTNEQLLNLVKHSSTLKNSDIDRYNSARQEGFDIAKQLFEQMKAAQNIQSVNGAFDNTASLKEQGLEILGDVVREFSPLVRDIIAYKMRLYADIKNDNGKSTSTVDMQSDDDGSGDVFTNADDGAIKTRSSSFII